MTILSLSVAAQNGIIRGNVTDSQSGEALAFALVQLNEQSTTTDIEGFFSFTHLRDTIYHLNIQYLGYQPLDDTIHLTRNQIWYQKLRLEEDVINLGTVEVSASNQQNPVTSIGNYWITPERIQQMPALGQGDLAQYLTQLPGVVTTGDQGGQLYIQGGDPHQNLLLIDGIPVVNAFHSLSAFSVVPADALQQVTLYGTAYPANFGGRISSVMDLRLREGASKPLEGMVGVDPLSAQVRLQGRIYAKGDQQWTWMLAGRESLWPYVKDIVPASYRDALDFKFRDLTLKTTWQGENGSKLSFTSLQMSDEVPVSTSTNVRWTNQGYGMQFRVLPTQSEYLIGGSVAYSDYRLDFTESGTPRSTGFRQANAQLWFANGQAENRLEYGITLNAIRSDLAFKNPQNITFSRDDNASELAVYGLYDRSWGKWRLEPGLRLQYHASVSYLSLEPRLLLQWQPSTQWQWSLAGGRYSQNLISARSNQDVVHFYQVFITGPEGLLYNHSGSATKYNVQTSWHLGSGIQWRNQGFSLKAEAYLKWFDQLIEINREKLKSSDPDFVTETGRSYGVSFAAEWANSDWLLGGHYTYAHADRTIDGTWLPAIFDRKHQMNIQGRWSPGNQGWSFSIRGQVGSGFPFTRTAGFYPVLNWDDGLLTDVIGGKNDVGVLYESPLFQGRLPDYLRWDAQIGKSWTFDGGKELEVSLSCINLLNRKNIFYFDRIQYQRVDQLPFLPLLVIQLHW
ncbi:MAG: TonB-dependent receptor [Saprospiraceae bacterium]